jgi:ABC-type uncharacterized transport system ATPase subunit
VSAVTPGHPVGASHDVRASAAAPVLVLRNITKRFPGVVANDEVTLEVRAGEVHALLGENGAGKTTLMNILYGVYQPEAGEIVVRGRPVRVRSPRDAIAMGIGMVPQHFLLVRRHTVAENIALALSRDGFLFPARRIERRITDLGGRYGLAVDPKARIWELSASEQQRVEILKALIRGAEILMLDEPTSVLTPQEALSLFEVLRRMKHEGHAIVFITHKLDEVAAIAERVTVLRRGAVVGTVSVSEVDKGALARMMVGREVEFGLRRTPRAPGAPVLTVETLTAKTDRGSLALHGVGFTVHEGEILGVAGVAGNGQRELVEVLTGLRLAAGGTVRVGERDVTNRSAREILEAGVAHIPEDRLHLGVVPAMSVAENLVLRHYRYAPFSRGPMLQLQAVRTFARELIAEYDIVTPGPDAPVRQLSGGNIQRLILGRELFGAPRLIIAAHPTSGLDVSATEQIHALLLRRRDDGAAILLVSEDLDEILTLSDRVAVLFRGEIVGVVPAHEAKPERIGLLMMGQRS